MPILSFYRQEVTRIRPSTKVSRGSNVPDWNNADELLIKECSVVPAGTSLNMGERVEGISDGLTAYLPVNADVVAGDRIKFEGEIYTIMGEPRRWISATGNLDHIILNLMRWEG